MRDALTYSEVASVLRHEDGKLFWRVSRSRVRAGDEAGGFDKNGYVSLRINRRDLLGHRVVWLLVHGSWPTSMIDHKDGNPSNNHPDNLRLCSNSQNQCNRRPRPRLKGVTLHKQTGKFQAACGTTYLGLFVNAEDAARAYDAAAIKRYGEFARINFGATK